MKCSFRREIKLVFAESGKIFDGLFAQGFLLELEGKRLRMGVTGCEVMIGNPIGAKGDFRPDTHQPINNFPTSQLSNWMP